VSSTDALYQELILEHNRKPKNFREMEDATISVEGRNRLCGDALTLWVKLSGDEIADVSFKGQGCAISKASASLMTSAIKGKSRAEAEQLFEQFHKLVTGSLDEGEPKTLRSFRAFAGLSKFTIRVKCASLAWHAMRSALDGSAQPVTTDDADHGPPPGDDACPT
jgi:nitrogen fixation NifU-like protein